jgi:hypothetical protein
VTGVPARERAQPGVPPVPGTVERRAFAYVRQGPIAVIVRRDVGSGQVLAPAGGPPRTAADFLAHRAQTGATDPAASRGHCVVDQLNRHRSRLLVRSVAAGLDVTEDLGVPGPRGSLRTRHPRAACLREPRHRSVGHYTPKPASWMHQIEIWLSILPRTLRRRGNFPSVAARKAKVLACIDSSNRTMAKPCTWPDQGKPLAA